MSVNESFPIFAISLLVTTCFCTRWSRPTNNKDTLRYGEVKGQTKEHQSQIGPYDLSTKSVILYWFSHLENISKIHFCSVLTWILFAVHFFPPSFKSLQDTFWPMIMGRDIGQRRQCRWFLQINQSHQSEMLITGWTYWNISSCIIMAYMVGWDLM